MIDDSIVGELRSQHPWFKYQSSHWHVVAGALHLSWKFLIEPSIEFTPTMVIPLPDFEWQQRVSNITIDRLVFNIGMVELLSYWKATASPNIIIQAGYLNEDQLIWWHNLLTKGMGEYFYLNQINFTTPDFVTLNCTVAPVQDTESQVENQSNTVEQTDRFLIPIGGGKDSIVAMELLRQWRQHQAEPVKPDQLNVLAVNPTAAASTVMNQSGYHVLTIQRNLDPKLLLMNQQGFINGHTPFSALLSFITLLTATLHGFTATVLGNEQSANEGNVQYFGQNINHQYSKSFEYETAFNNYVTTYLQPQSSTVLPKYFSILRPFNELQIAQIFSQQAEAYLPIFRSCNRGQRTNTWCGECAKCLFAYIVLFPFLGEQQMVSIFGRNLFQNDRLLATALELIGETTNKPFDCVGTYQESRVAFYLSYRWYLAHDLEIPNMLTVLSEKYLANTTELIQVTKQILSQFNEDNLIPTPMSQYLQRETSQTI